MKNILSKINDNKVKIITRTAIVGAGVIAVTLAAGLVKIKPSEKTVEIVEEVAKAAKKAAE